MKTEKGPNIPGPIFTDCLGPENGKCLKITFSGNEARLGCVRKSIAPITFQTR